MSIRTIITEYIGNNYKYVQKLQSNSNHKRDLAKESVGIKSSKINCK